MLPKEIAKLVPKTHLMSEAEWRSIGVQQSQGWKHYMIHEPGMKWDILFMLLAQLPIVYFYLFLLWKIYLMLSLVMSLHCSYVCRRNERDLPQGFPLIRKYDVLCEFEKEE